MSVFGTPGLDTSVNIGLSGVRDYYNMVPNDVQFTCRGISKEQCDRERDEKTVKALEAWQRTGGHVRDL